MPKQEGSIVRLQGLQNNPQLNGREGFIYAAQNENGRFGVRLFNLRVDDMRISERDEMKDLRKLIRPPNLEELESSYALLVTPTAGGGVTVKRFEFDCPMGREAQEMACIKRKLGWSQVTSCGQFCYSQARGPANPVARLQRRDPRSVRGPAVVVRAEPPRVLSSYDSVDGPSTSHESQDTSLWTPRLGHKELRDTLAFFATTAFDAVDKVRAMKRMGVRGADAANMPHLFF
ncbi:hypothetical protein JKP88DRAFT_274006 [Tribonema minus]|uniref:Uncharacterized protein n=1 Tax=Tribonema minus TaxID=303371 RepID=A0A835YMB3_9STRA|nr:hypothetical protein JKP88DRAFT_274006 [Tribonema minus]